MSTCCPKFRVQYVTSYQGVHMFAQKALVYLSKCMHRVYTCPHHTLASKQCTRELASRRLTPSQKKKSVGSYLTIRLIQFFI